MTFEANVFQGKHVLVTGATQGIGAGIANYLQQLGAKVTAVGIDNGDGSLLPDVKIKHADVSKAEDVERLFDGVDTLNFVINCAGIIRRGDEHQLDVFEQVVDVNLTGTMRICSAARPLLKQSNGVVVNMASMLSFFGGSLVPAYAASKGGVAQLTKSLALAYAQDGIRVNAVAPGWIATPLTVALQNDPARSEPILNRTPLGRWGTPDDVAKAVAFLCSDAAAFMTGVILPVDGGYLIA
ncbi:SDR family oxidoreductase [Paenalcaligenes niemegkensis]|uniref:SDR family NAD(P)-dependent oxidoreductase n=1 Tax=Paenalcaligenes niemegkensis TaxID=2895469 RepID=UPI001EE98DBA|nr:SDR family oxidoreductase [Paenalcaligenes niemegkensis]MCQ9618287.1 SDR family oxidoreductase [Paenalcaligenes niemegkensis]